MVDDHPIVREGMALFLNAQPDLHLCCEAASAQDAMTEMATCKPALAIVDISLHKESGLDLIKLMRRRNPGLAILAMSLHDEQIFAERALPRVVTCARQLGVPEHTAAELLHQARHSANRVVAHQAIDLPVKRPDGKVDQRAR